MTSILLCYLMLVFMNWFQSPVSGSLPRVAWKPSDDELYEEELLVSTCLYGVSPAPVEEERSDFSTSSPGSESEPNIVLNLIVMAILCCFAVLFLCCSIICIKNYRRRRRRVYRETSEEVGYNKYDRPPPYDLVLQQEEEPPTYEQYITTITKLKESERKNLWLTSRHFSCPAVPSRTLFTVSRAVEQNTDSNGTEEVVLRVSNLE